MSGPTGSAVDADIARLDARPEEAPMLPLEWAGPVPPWWLPEEQEELTLLWLGRVGETGPGY